MNLKKTAIAVFLLPLALVLSQNVRADFSFSIGISNPVPYFYSHAYWPASGHFAGHLNYPYFSYYMPAHYYFPYYSHFYYPYYSYYNYYWYRPYRYYSHRPPYRYRYPNHHRHNHDHDYTDREDRDNHYYPRRNNENGHGRTDRQRQQFRPGMRHNSRDSDNFSSSLKSAHHDNEVNTQTSLPRYGRSDSAGYVTDNDRDKSVRNIDIAGRLIRKDSHSGNSDGGYNTENRRDNTIRDDANVVTGRQHISDEDQYGRSQIGRRQEVFERRESLLNDPGPQRTAEARRSDQDQTRHASRQMRRSNAVEPVANDTSSRQSSRERNNEVSMNEPREEYAGNSRKRGNGYSRGDR